MCQRDIRGFLTIFVRKEFEERNVWRKKSLWHPTTEVTQGKSSHILAFGWVHDLPQPTLDSRQQIKSCAVRWGKVFCRWQTIPVCTGLRGFPEHGAFSFKTWKVPGKPGQGGLPSNMGLERVSIASYIQKTGWQMIQETRSRMAFC